MSPVTGSLGVKICGICTPDDAVLAVEAGATHIGVIRVPGSRRTRSREEAAAICEAASGARRVGVFVDADPEVMLEEAAALGLEVFQLHGGEPVEVVEAVVAAGYGVWKVLKPGDRRELLDDVRRYRAADLILVEGRSERGAGGVGAPYPREVLRSARSALPPEPPLGLAGGLTPETVEEAVRTIRPALVDVSSGVEAELCRKDPARVRAFVRAAHRGATL